MVIITYPELDGTLGALELDVTVRDTHRSAADVTEHAVEDGANVTDHVRPQQDRLSLEGWVSNTPLRLAKDHTNGVTGSVRTTELQTPAGALLGSRAASVFRLEGDYDRVTSVHEELRRLIRQGIVCGISTSLRDYENMVLHDLEAPRDAESGNQAVRVRIEAKQVRIVSTETVAVQEEPRDARGRGRRRQGPQTPQPGSDQQAQRTSLLRQLATGAGLM